MKIHSVLAASMLSLFVLSPVQADNCGASYYCYGNTNPQRDSGGVANLPPIAIANANTQAQIAARLNRTQASRPSMDETELTPMGAAVIGARPQQAQQAARQTAAQQRQQQARRTVAARQANIAVCRQNKQNLVNKAKKLETMARMKQQAKEAAQAKRLLSNAARVRNSVKAMRC